jgi:hypothetical protein
MAIEFLVMPLSRYLAGDFVTPAMRSAWQCGAPYARSSRLASAPTALRESRSGVIEMALAPSMFGRRDYATQGHRVGTSPRAKG